MPSVQPVKCDHKLSFVEGWDDCVLPAGHAGLCRWRHARTSSVHLADWAAAQRKRRGGAARTDETDVRGRTAPEW